MPAPITPSLPSLRPSGRTYRVRPGDTLTAIAGRMLGDSSRWKEIYALNRSVIGSDPAHLRLGASLRIPGAAPQPKPPQVDPARPDADRDGVIDRYDAAPDDARDRRWNQTAASEFAAFVPEQTAKARAQGIEVDCADFAVLMLKEFCAAVGLPNPLEKEGKWSVYTPNAPGGLPNVQGPNHVLTGLYADRLAKEFTVAVNDANGNGIVGADGTGAVDVADLRGGDVLFYDWNTDGKVDHTVQVLGVQEDGTVEIAYGTYDNLGEAGPVTWTNLDLSPIQRLTLKPGSADFEKYLGAGNALWGARRYNWTPEHTSNWTVPVAPEPVAPVKPEPEVGLFARLRRAAVRVLGIRTLEKPPESPQPTLQRRAEWDLKRIA
jgi:hypothetical protein